MNPSTKRILFSTIVLIVLLGACAPAQAPTQDPAQIQSQIAESVAMTVAAQQTQAAEEQAQIALSNTPLPTQTEVGLPSATPIVPTATPFVIVPPTTGPVASGGGGGVPVVKPELACDVIHQRPFDDTSFKPNDTFDVKWTIVNTGTKTWRAGLDLKYLSGPKMTATNTIELPQMKPGDQFDIVLDATAPKENGMQVMVWVLEGPICYPYVRIIVEK
jgi:hypothetical protein